MKPVTLQSPQAVAPPGGAPPNRGLPRVVSHQGAWQVRCDRSPADIATRVVLWLPWLVGLVTLERTLGGELRTWGFNGPMSASLLGSVVVTVAWWLLAIWLTAYERRDRATVWVDDRRLVVEWRGQFSRRRTSLPIHDISRLALVNGQIKIWHGPAVTYVGVALAPFEVEPMLADLRRRLGLPEPAPPPPNRRRA